MVFNAIQRSVRTMDSMVMQFHIVAAPLSQQPGKLDDDKTEFKKTSKFRLAVSSQKRREWEDTTRQKWLVFQKSKNQTKLS